MAQILKSCCEVLCAAASTDDSHLLKVLKPALDLMQQDFVFPFLPHRPHSDLEMPCNEEHLALKIGIWHDEQPTEEEELISSAHSMQPAPRQSKKGCAS